MLNRIEAKTTAKDLLRDRTAQDGLILFAIMLGIQVVPWVLRTLVSPVNVFKLLGIVEPVMKGDVLSFLGELQGLLAGMGTRVFLTLLISVLITLVHILFDGGLIRTALRLSGGDKSVRAVDTILAYDHLGRYVLIALCRWLLLLAWSLPGAVFQVGGVLCIVAGAVKSSGGLIVLGVILFLCGCIWTLVISIIKNIEYGFAIHVCEQEPERDFFACVRASKELTEGHVMELFVTELSFLGWDILETIIFPAKIFTVPYRCLTYVVIYRQLAGKTVSAPRADRKPGGGAEAAVRSEPMLMFLTGEYAGSEIRVPEGGELRIGRDPAQANVVVSEDKAQISGLHCGVRYDSVSDCYMVTDYSTNGTFVGGARLPSGSTKVRRGTTVKLAGGEVLFRLG